MKLIIHFFMPKTRQRKELDIKQFVEKAKKTKAAIFVRYKGVTVKSEQELREKLRAEGNAYTAIKKTLLQKALKDLGLDIDQLKDMQGSIAVAFGLEDEVSVAKILYEFGKTNPGLELLGGIYNGSIIQREEVKQLATLPTKDQLLAQLVFVIASPLRGFASVLNGPSRDLVRALHALQEKKSS
jgi:large subunit ribosomal protein L10